MNSNFYIEIIEDSVIENDEVIAQIKIDEFEESFTLLLEYFNINDYLNHWYSALNDLLKNHNSVAL
ncbi:MAG TPA: hypothetical protein VLN45_10550, partial [Ignavibacteriaceae bacterium]|nr:hypothetical protein [Ignavibacteriaceae bacterium]